jgi:hypothetical protein
MASATVAPPTNGQHALVGTLVFIGLVLAAVGSLGAGRGFQGMGLGLTALVIGVARDAFRGTHFQSVIGLLSVTSVAVVASGIRWPGSPPTSGDCVAPTWRAASSRPPR